MAKLKQVILWLGPFVLGYGVGAFILGITTLLHLRTAHMITAPSPMVAVLLAHLLVVFSSVASGLTTAFFHMKDAHYYGLKPRCGVYAASVAFLLSASLVIPISVTYGGLLFLFLFGLDMPVTAALAGLLAKRIWRKS